MIAALVVVVLVTATEAQSAQTSGVALALEEALESGSAVVVQAAPARPEDEDLAAIAQAAHADAVAAVSWTAADGSQAHLRVQRVGASTAAERDLEFKRSDASVERGRTVGFALASMLPRVDAPSPLPAEAIPAPPAKEPLKDDTIKTPAWGVDLAFATAIGLGGSGSGLGGTVGLRRQLTPSIDARAVLSTTRGSVSDAQASITLVRPRAGIGILVLRRQSVVARARVETGPWLHDVSRSGVGRTSGSRWLPGVGVAAEIEWTIAPSVALTFDLGLDVAFGTTRVIVGGKERASIAPEQAVGDIGVRLLF